MGGRLYEIKGVLDEGDVFYRQRRIFKRSESPEMTVGGLLKDAQVTWERGL